MAATKPPKPPPKRGPKARKPAAKQARAARVVRQAVAGVPVRAIAEAEGVSRQAIYKTLRSDDCRQIGVALCNKEIGLISTIFKSALRAIDEALNADRPEQRDRQGKVTVGGPDHYARMTAVARLCKVMTLGRPTALVPENRKPGSLLLPTEAPFVRSDPTEDASDGAPPRSTH